MLKNDLVEMIRKSELACYTASLEEWMQPCIRINARPIHDSTLAIGSSKFGGLPDLPPEYTWPEHQGHALLFLCQFQLSDLLSIKPVAPEGQTVFEELQSDHLMQTDLPSSGMLYFFYDAYQQPWGFTPEDRGNWRVLYYDGDPGRLDRRPIPASIIRAEQGGTEDEYLFNPCALTFSVEWSLPPLCSLEIEALDLNENRRSLYWDLVAEINHQRSNDSFDALHHLLGHPAAIQGEMRLECQLASNGLSCGRPEDYRRPDAIRAMEYAGEWQLLLQIDTDEEPNWMWGDAGRIFFWIQKEALRARDFSNVWLVLQCY